MSRWLWPCAVLCLAAAVLAGEAEKPIDKPGLPPPTIEEMDKPTRSPAPPPAALTDEEAGKTPAKEGEAPEKQGFSPFRRRGTKPKYAVPARVTYSDGKALDGWVWRRANAPIRVFDRSRKAHEDYFLGDLTSIRVKPETENFERDWRWKNQGSSIKVFLDIGYFWNQYVTTCTTADGETASGDCSGQFYILLPDGKRDKWYLYKRQSGRDVEKKKRHELKPLVYVKTVAFTDEFLKKLEEKQKAESEKKAEAEQE